VQCASAILLSVPCAALLIFSTSSHERHDFRKKVTNNCVLIFSTKLAKTFLTLRRSERDMIKMYISLQVKYLLFIRFE